MHSVRFVGTYRNTLFDGIHNFIHMNLIFALLFALIAFVGGIQTANENKVRHIREQFIFEDIARIFRIIKIQNILWIYF